MRITEYRKSNRKLLVREGSYKMNPAKSPEATNCAPRCGSLKLSNYPSLQNYSYPSARKLKPSYPSILRSWLFLIQAYLSSCPQDFSITSFVPQPSNDLFLADIVSLKDLRKSQVLSYRQSSCSVHLSQTALLL